MPGFFDHTRPSTTVELATASFELPILYFRDDTFVALFSADYQRVRALLPSDRLHPVQLPGGRAIVGVAAYNYIDTSVGPYGEVGVAVVAVHAERPPLPLVPGLLQTRYPGFGYVVLHLPVTNALARDAGRGQWGYPKFVADMRFRITPEFQQCELSEGGRHILTLRVARRGLIRPERDPLVTYTVKDGDLLRTVIPQTGTKREALFPSDSSLVLGDHAVAGGLRELDLSARPFMTRYYVERSGILPAGKVLERGVRPLDGLVTTRDAGEHEVCYT